jgi:hypothetical protein
MVGADHVRTTVRPRSTVFIDQDVPGLPLGGSIMALTDFSDAPGALTFDFDASGDPGGDTAATGVNITHRQRARRPRRAGDAILRLD